MLESTAALGQALFTGIWNLFDIQFPGFNFTFRQFWIAVALLSSDVSISSVSSVSSARAGTARIKRSRRARSRERNFFKIHHASVLPTPDPLPDMDPGPSPALPEPPAENQPPVEVPPVDLDAPSGPGGLDAPTYDVTEAPNGDIIIEEHSYTRTVDILGLPVSFNLDDDYLRQGGKTDKTEDVNNRFRSEEHGHGLEHFRKKSGHVFHYLNTPPRSFMKQ